MGVCARQTISLSVLARNPNKGFELEIFRETGSGRGEGSPREEKGSVDKGTQRGQWRAVGFELAVQRMTESIEVRKATTKT